MPIHRRLKNRAAETAARAKERVSDVDRETIKRLAREAARDEEPQQRQRKDGADVDHRRVAPESDEDGATFRRAEDHATMGAPLDATLDPLTSPEEMEKLCRGKGGECDDPEDLGWFGSSDDDPDGFFGAGSGTESEDDDDPLSFDDSFGLGYGGDSDGS